MWLRTTGPSLPISSPGTLPDPGISLVSCVTPYWSWCYSGFQHLSLTTRIQYVLFAIYSTVTLQHSWPLCPLEPVRYACLPGSSWPHGISLNMGQFSQDRRRAPHIPQRFQSKHNADVPVMYVASYIFITKHLPPCCYALVYFSACFAKPAPFILSVDSVLF